MSAKAFLPAKDVAAAVNRFAKARIERHAKEREELIVAAMAPRRVWFCRSVRTREEAIAYLKSPSDLWGSAWSNVAERGSRWWDLAHRAGDLALMAGPAGVIEIDDTLASVLEPYYFDTLKATP